MEKNPNTYNLLKNEIIVDSPDDLRVVLVEHGVNVSDWKHELSHKTVDDLWQEIIGNEASITLENGEIFRNIEVVRAKAFALIEGSPHMLCEYQQYDGCEMQRRTTKSSFSEKKIPDESIETVLARALGEELGVDFLAENLCGLEQIPKFSVRESRAFPSLQTKYSFYDAQIELLGEQIKPEYKEEQPEKGKTNYFFWEEIQ